MIRKVILRRFKRFEEVAFDIPGHVVLAGPNNTGKTTLLQALASWNLALTHWKKLNDYNKRRGYTKVPIARQAFSTVPLRNFDLLWHRRNYKKRPIEIEVRRSDGGCICMELIPDSTEQIYVRPRSDVSAELLSQDVLGAVFVPPMTGLAPDEPVLQTAKIEQLMGSGRPGEVLRNLLLEANRNQEAWEALLDSIERLFGYELLPPDSSRADIIAEYRQEKGGRALDIASAGSGFQQVLMLLTLLNTRAGSVLLLDEPDAHLHVILQDAIYGELRKLAAHHESQLILATHSEVVIDTVDPRELCVLLNEPRILADSDERRQLIRSLRVLSNTDLMQAGSARGILYTEDHTDISILRAWADRLDHRALPLLTKELMWKRTVVQPREGAAGIQGRDHYKALTMAQEGIPGLELVDGDANPSILSSEITGRGFQRLRWRRYEIESYLVHPAALARFVEHQVGRSLAEQHIEDLHAHFENEYPPAVLKDPLGEHEYLNTTKARTRLLPPALNAAGLHGFPYTRYNEIAALMIPEEIHPEVTEKLDAICRAFGIDPDEPA
ncbi:MAG: hypothetical protein CME06_10285 [Gemmatimonadetes bacterium]|nr:hypothetical protein [Gemmatimonadota bacterium]